MQNGFICPFFGFSKEWCDKGCNGYVSIYDGRSIVKKCIDEYKECERYAYLKKKLFSVAYENNYRTLSPYSLLR